MDENILPDSLNNSHETAATIAKRTGLSYPMFEMGHSALSVETGRIK
jgi:capsule polysaccharide modification protein KpsS